jgi:CTP:molybdopterin cytidylyltransferase MocA
MLPIIAQRRHAGPRVRQLAVLILAAGGSARLGRPKQLVRHHGESLVQRCARLALALEPLWVGAVVGAAASRVGAELDRLPVAVIRNRAWRTGLAGSLRAGLGRTPRAARAVLILTVDQWRLEARDLRALIRLARGAQPVAAAYAGRIGVPAVFPRSWWARLRRLSGDAGAGVLLRAAPVLTVPIEAAATDLDDAAGLRQLRGARSRARG